MHDQIIEVCQHDKLTIAYENFTKFTIVVSLPSKTVSLCIVFCIVLTCNDDCTQLQSGLLGSDIYTQLPGIEYCPKPSIAAVSTTPLVSLVELSLIQWTTSEQ